MRIMSGKTVLIVMAAIGLASCSSKSDESSDGSSASDQPAVIKADKTFATAGTIEMRLSAGNYTIRASSDGHIRVSFAGNIGKAAAELTTSGTSANLLVTETPHNNFQATVEVPATSDLTVQLSAGNVEIAKITGNKNIDSSAGNVTIVVADVDEYGTVDASVKVGNLDGGPFGSSGSGLAPHLKWSGTGKYTLRASLGAGNLELKK